MKFFKPETKPKTQKKKLQVLYVLLETLSGIIIFNIGCPCLHYDTVKNLIATGKTTNQINKL